MTEARRRAYLEAMGFDIWVAKPPGPGPVRLVVGPGAGGDLLICAAPDASSGKLAADIARALGDDPVWAWPDPEGDLACPTVDEAVADRLFTRLLVFGEELARDLFGPESPEVLGSAAVRVAPAMDELAVRGNAKQAFWRLICGRAN
ncbi:MAG: hypothetical protein P8Y54_09965 [Xanthomonadales bacterium]